MRLDKLLSHAGYGTRKQVKELIKNREVSVDNKVITKSNIHIDPERQLIEVNNQRVDYQKYIYIMLNKPPNYLSATVDRYDKTVLDLIPEKYKHYNLAPVGRLDKDTEGLLLLTNDGQLNHVLTSPNKKIFKTYFAKIKGIVEEKHIKKFEKGVILDDGYQTKEAFLDILKSDTISEIKLSISEGKFHQVKRMFQAIDMQVLYLKRTSMGNLSLDKNLSIGEIRLLNESEITYLQSLKK
ncbi:pseudouridine synthase [Pseudogracilibacillus sp. SE30717A]|uniref:pseudouridine synthase n=1 Tax=Pseudogracilibacillus sp. SE30717A TaxID=3098293 RepID=UPI00300E0568